MDNPAIKIIGLLYPLRLLYTIIFFFSFAFCSSPMELKKSDEVIIVMYPNEFKGQNISLDETVNAVKFSKEFWKYFLVSHPRVALTIFGFHLYAEHYPYFQINDTLFEYFPVIKYAEDLSRCLSDSAGGIEKVSCASGTIWKTGLKYNPQARKVDREVAEEFDTFKKILSFRDEQKYYVIIYRKNIIKSLLP